MESSIQYQKCDEETDFLCCCSVEIPHDETMKFQLRFKDDNEEYGEKILFGKRARGEVQFVNFYNLNNTIFFGIDAVVGFNKQLYEIYQYLVFQEEKIRVVLILGLKGSGKTTLAKKFANYANERKNLKGTLYLDLSSVQEFFQFKHELMEKLSQIKQSGSSQKKPQLVILDNLDKLITRESSQLNKCLE